MLKFLILSFLGGIFLTFSVQAQNVPVPQTSAPVIMKTSASWCSLCGGYGWNFFQQLLNDHQHQAVIFAGHISGDFNSSDASQIGANFGVYGHPTFLFNGVNKGLNSGNTNAKRAEIASDVQNFLSANPPVQLGIDANYSGNQLSVNYSLKAFTDLTGDYHVAFYLSEKEKVGQQTPIGSQAVHKNLFRHELNNNTFGQKIFSGNTPSGTVYDSNFSVALGNYNPGNLEIIGIIWKATGNSFQIVNANVDKSVQQSTDLYKEEMDESTFKVFPTVISGKACIEILAENQISDADIYLTDVTGKKLAEIFSGSLTSGKHNFYLHRAEIGSSGLYLIVFRAGNSVKTSKLIMD